MHRSTVVYLYIHIPTQMESSTRRRMRVLNGTGWCNRNFSMTFRSCMQGETQRTRIGQSIILSRSRRNCIFPSRICARISKHQMYAHTLTHTYAHLHTFTHTYTHTHTYTYLHILTHTFKQRQTYTHIPHTLTHTYPHLLTLKRTYTHYVYWGVLTPHKPEPTNNCKMTIWILTAKIRIIKTTNSINCMAQGNYL